MRRLKHRYGRAGKRRSAAAYDFLRSMHGWTITSESGSHLVAHRMAGRQGDPDGPSVEFVRVSPRQWRAFYAGKAGTGTLPSAAAAAVGVGLYR